MNNDSLRGAQKLIKDIYGIPDDRLYEVEDLLYYGQRFTLDYINELRKNNLKNAKSNLIISFAWFLALMNRYHISLESICWRRYSYKCPFCLEIPCNCSDKENIKSQKTGRPSSRKPTNLNEWQDMIKKIYQNGELHELNYIFLDKLNKLHYALRRFLRAREKKYFKEIEIHSADYFILLMRIFNLLDKNFQKSFISMFSNGCHICHKTPCECNYF